MALGSLYTKSEVDRYLERDSEVSNYLDTQRLGDTATSKNNDTSESYAFRSTLNNMKDSSYKADSKAGLGENLGRTFLGGAISGVGGDFVETGRQLGIVSDPTATSAQKYLETTARGILDKRSSSYKREAEKRIFDDEGNFTGDFTATTLLDRLAGSAPEILATIVPAAGLNKLATASKWATKLGLSQKVGGALNSTLSAGISEGLVAGASSANQHRLEALEVPIETYRKNPLFAEELAKTDQTLPLEQREQLAKESLANQSANEVFSRTAFYTGGIGALTGGGAIGSLINKAPGKITGNIVKRIGKGAGSEAYQEAPQSFTEQRILNEAKKKYIDVDTDLEAGTINALAEGAVVGAVSGGVLGVADTGEAKKQEIVNPITNKKFVNKDVQNSYSNFIDTFKNNKDTNNPDYQDSYSSVVSSLNKTIKEEQKKNKGEEDTSDSVKILEAEQALRAITSAHNSLLREEQASKAKAEAEEAAVKVGDESANADSSRTPQEIEEIVNAEPVSVNERNNQDSLSPEDLYNNINIENLSNNSKKRILDAGLVENPEDLEYSDKEDISSVSTEELKSFSDTLTNNTESLSQDEKNRSSSLNQAVQEELDNRSKAPVTPQVEEEVVPSTEDKDNVVDLYHSSSKELDTLSPDKSEHFGVHLSNKETSDFISSTSDKTNQYTTKVDTSNFVEIEDLDSWNIVNILKALTETPWYKELNQSVKDKIAKGSLGIVNRYKREANKVGVDSVAISNKYNKDLAKLLSSKEIGLPGLKYVNKFENAGNTSYILLKDTKVEKVNKDAPKEVAIKNIVTDEVKTSAASKLIANKKKAKATVQKDLIEQEVSENLENPVASTQVATKRAIASSNEPLESLSIEESESLSKLNKDLARITNAYNNSDKSEAKTEKYEIERGIILEEITNLRSSGKKEVKDVTSESYTPTSEDLEDIDDFVDETFTNEDLEVLFSYSSKNNVSNLAPVDHDRNRAIVARVIESLKDTLIKKFNLKIVYLENFSRHNFPFKVASSYTDPNSNQPRGFYTKSNGINYIYLNGKYLHSARSLVGTTLHELGHFGMREIIGNDSYNNMLMGLLSDPKYINDILKRQLRWKAYLKDWVEKHYPKAFYPTGIPQSDIQDGLKHGEGIMFEEIYIPVEVALKLADEHIAELVRESYLDEEFLRNNVGLGKYKGEDRRAIRRSRIGWIRAYLKKLRHFLRKIFGQNIDQISEFELKGVVAHTLDTMFETINPDYIFSSTKPFVSPITIHLEEADMEHIEISAANLDGDISYDIQDGTQLSEEDIANTFRISSIENLVSFENGYNSGFGEHADTIRSKFWNDLQDKITANPILSWGKALGSMSNQKVYSALQTISKGDISRAESYVKDISNILNTLDPLQNQAVFEYFTTKGSDVEELPLSSPQKKAVKRAKDSIRELGKSLHEFGLISDESYEANEDAYLHTVYLKYIDQYRGSNKNTSMLSWMKKRKNISEREKLALGMIKDVRFLVPETLGVIARDHVLLKMFDNIQKMSIENNLFWVLTSDMKVKYPGRRKKLTLDQAYDQLKQNELIINSHEENSTQTFGTAGKDELIKGLIKDTAVLRENIAKIEAAEADLLNKAYAHATSNNQTSSKTTDEFLRNHYIKLPNKDNLGSLRNKWVRKEIADDLDAYTSAFTINDKNSIEKFLARGGTLERINRFWKLSMVALNPASWVRNTFGNFALLDLSTSTSKMKLIKMLHEEVSGVMNNNQSKYWKLSNDYGLFGSTWSAVELQDMQSKYSEDLKKAKRDFEARQGSAIDSQLHFLDERMMSIAGMLKHKVGTNTSKMYSLLEGAFKTTAFRDYLNIWEEQNKAEYPDGFESLPDDKRQILLTKAASHANDSIFDYSQVNSMVKTLRRVPFGSPFITYTYKAGPAAVKAMINHPLKFAQYATLPALLTFISQIANDWDDDDVDEFRKALPDYYRTNPGVAFLPFKDKFGRVQILPLDYIVPWSQWTTAARKVYENFIEDGGESPISTGVRSVGTAVNSFGFLGGPTPTGIAAMLSGKDDFTGRDIITPGASASTKLGESMMFGYNMFAPAWLSSHGWFAKMYDAFKDKPTTNRFGDIKYSPLQALSDITGFRPIGIDQRAGLENRKLSFEMRLKDIKELRSKIIRDRNETNKASKIKELNDREKLVRRQMQEAL
ncbi:DNA repair protein [Caudoviricetes sp.]|nr:DNA repair protein [Caudoviricetes sp.]